jgi:hypothetical protein
MTSNKSINSCIEGTMKILSIYFLFILATSCATAPTQEELANLDYGTCPTGYVEKIKARFEGGFWVAYKGKPMIWTPLRYGYRAGVMDGGQLYAGYLVQVVAHQTRGNPNTLGKQLYGFLFKNSEIIKEIPPMDMQAVSIPAAVGPLPFDDRKWEVGHTADRENQIVVEWILPGETVQDWSELITLQSLKASLEDTPEQIARRLEESFRRDCANVKWNTLTASDMEVTIERVTTGCAPLIDEYSIEKIIRGPRAIHRVAYTSRTPLGDSERETFTPLIKRASLFPGCG